MLYQLIFFFLALSTVSLYGNDWVDDVNCNVECFHKSRDRIPPELRNLPYALYRTSPGYNVARFNFNKLFNYYFPKAIFYPRNEQEALFVFNALKRHCLRFSVRSGGHCIEPGSLSEDYIFDLSNFNQIIPDIPNSLVNIGAGCRLQSIINTLGEINYAIPSGTCPSVGIAGLAMGGGIGLLSREFGLTCDSVRSITLLTADLGIIEVSATQYPDLFWALLGAGNGSYGIALGFTFQMYFIPEVSFYEIMWEFDPRLIPPIMRTWQTWVQTLPNNITSVLGIRHPDHLTAQPENSPPLVIRIFGLKVGSDQFTEAQGVFDSLNPMTTSIFTGTYLDMSQFWANESPLPFEKIKSRILMQPVSENVIDEVTCFFTRLQERNPDFLVYFNFERFGGVIPNFQTSYFPRNAFAWWEQAYYWGCRSESKEVLALSREFYASIPREVSKFCYANIVDYDIGRKYLRLYYGNHVDRLIQVKNKYDPNNLFHWRQSIPLRKR